MTPKEIIEKLRLTFSELVNNADAPVMDQNAPEMIVPTIAKLKDGTEVEISELSVGGIVTIQGQPAPVGDHELEDGTVISVGDNGAITAIVPAPSAPSMVEDMGKKQKMEELFEAFQSTTNEKFASYEAKFADYEAKLKKATKVIEGLLNLTQTLAETPTGVADPIVKTTNNFKEEKTDKNYSVLFN
jgi:spore coat protein CotH